MTVLELRGSAGIEVSRALPLAQLLTTHTGFSLSSSVIDAPFPFDIVH